MNLNPNIYPANGPQQSGGSTHISSLTRYEPKSVEYNEAVSPEDLEPRRIELDRNFGTGPDQIHDRFVRSSLTEYMEEFRKVGADVSYFQSLMHSEYDSAESIADSDLEDGELRKNAGFTTVFAESRRLCILSNANRNGETCCIVTGERSNCKKVLPLIQGKACSSSREPSAPWKPAALFSFVNEEPRNQFKSSVFKNADPPTVGRSLLEGNKDHLLSQAKSELMRQEHQVGSLNNCVSE